MKQFQFTFRDDKKLEEELWKLRQWVSSNLCSKVLIQICTEILDRERIEHVCKTIARMLPEALYAGCSSNGNIVNGDFMLTYILGRKKRWRTLLNATNYLYYIYLAMSIESFCMLCFMLTYYVNHTIS